MARKKETFIQGRKHSWQSDARIDKILVQGQQIKVTHTDGAVSMLPVMGGIKNT